MITLRRIWSIALTIILSLIITILLILLAELKPEIPVIRLLEIFLTWPVIGGFLLIIFFIKYKSSIQLFLKNSSRIKFGDFEINSQQSKNIESDKDTASLSLSPSPSASVSSSPSPSPSASPSPISSGNNSNTINEAEIQLFEMLNKVLVFQTKNTLRFLKNVNAPLSETTIKDSINLAVGNITEQQQEKDAILYALLRLRLIEATAIATYQITDFGRKYLLYLGL